MATDETLTSTPTNRIEATQTPVTNEKTNKTTVTTQSEAKIVTNQDLNPFHNQTGILMGLNISLLECLFVLMEFIFGSSIFPAIWRLFLQYFCSKYYDQATCDEIYRILGYFTIAYWLLNRLSWNGYTSLQGILQLLHFTFNPDFVWGTLFSTEKIAETTNYNPKITSKTTPTAQKPTKGLKIFTYFIIAHAVSITIMLSLQAVTNTQVYTLDNFYVQTIDSATPQLDAMVVTSSVTNDRDVGDNIGATTDGVDTSNDAKIENDVGKKEQNDEKVFSPLHVLFLMVLAPLFEEIIFRCVMLTFVHIRLAKYFPGRIELTEKMTKEKESMQKKSSKLGTTKKIIIRKKKTNEKDENEIDENNNNQDDNNSSESPSTTTATTTVSLPQDKRYKTPPFNIAQYSSVLSGVAFGAIHFINLLNGYDIYYVTLQAIVGTFIGIVLNVAAYNHGHLVPLVIHILNNIVASFISQKTDIFASNLLIFGFFETILCYGILAYLSLKSLNNNDNQYVNAIILPKLPLPLPDNEVKQNEKKDEKTNTFVPIEFEIPRHYHAFNNNIIRKLSQQTDLPVSAK